MQFFSNLGIGSLLELNVDESVGEEESALHELVIFAFENGDVSLIVVEDELEFNALGNLLFDHADNILDNLFALRPLLEQGVQS